MVHSPCHPFINSSISLTDKQSFFGGFLTPILNPTSITTLLPSSLSGRQSPDLNPTPLEHLLGLQSSALMFMISLLTVVIMTQSGASKEGRWIVRGYVWVSAVTDVPQYVTLFFLWLFFFLLWLIFLVSRGGFVRWRLIDFRNSWASFAYVLGWNGLEQWRTWETPLYLQLFVPVLTMFFKAGYLSGAFGEDRGFEKEGVGKGKGRVGKELWNFGQRRVVRTVVCVGWDVITMRIKEGCKNWEVWELRGVGVERWWQLWDGVEYDKVK